MNYGIRLYELRKQKALSQEEVANELGVSRQSISLWETNQASPSMDNLIAFAKLFKVSLDELVGLENNPIKSNLHEEKPEYKITYEENRNTIYRRDFQYINSKKDLILAALSLFLYLMAFGMMLQATKLIIEVARIVMIISFLFIIVGSLIYPLYIYINLKKKMSSKNIYKIEIYKNYLVYSSSHSQEVMTDYKLVNYYIEKKDYFLVYLIRGNRIYIPKQSTVDLNAFLSDRIERRKRKKPLWNHI
ncbi:helix-turn-helix domain-containing protein [Mycoplasmatota bacterium WC30]